MLAVLFVILIVDVIEAGMFILLRQQLTTSKTSMYRAEARILANGAAERVLAWLSQHPTQYNAVPSSLTGGTLGDGTISVSVNDVNNLLQIASTATVNNFSVTSRVYLKRPDTTSPALACGVFTNSNFSMSGQTHVSASTWTNQSFSGGGGAMIDGTCTYVTTCKNSSNITPVKASYPIPFPQIDSLYYYQIALADKQVWTFNGTIYTNSATGATLHSGTFITFSPPQGIVWINCVPAGTMSINLSSKGSMQVNNGSLFINGAKSLDAASSSSLRITPKAGAGTTYFCPSLVLLDGNLTMAGSSDLLGAVYVANGTTSMSGGSTFYGSLISYGDLTLSGGAALDPKGQTFGFEQTNGSKLFELIMWER